MKNLSRLFIVLLLSISIISFIFGCDLSGTDSSNTSDQSLRSEEATVKKWAAKVSLGDKEADVKKKIGTEPFFTEKIADSDFQREIYFAEDKGLRSEKNWNDLLISSSEQNKPSLQVGFNKGIVEIINARLYLGDKAVDQRDQRASTFDNSPKKTLEHKNLDTRSGLHKKFDELATELSRVWGKGDNLSLEQVKKKLGEPSLTREIDKKVNLFYVEGGPKLNSEEELNNVIDQNTRDFVLVFVDKESGTKSAEFRHIYSVKKKEPSGQISRTFTRQIIDKAEDIKSKKGSPH